MRARISRVLWLIAIVVSPGLADQARSSPYAELAAGRVAELDARLNGLQAAFERDADAEEALQSAIFAFEALPRHTQAAEANLDSWIERYPRSYAARLARGFYRYQRGANTRGRDYVKDTPPENFETMHGWFEKAHQDLHASLELAARPVATRIVLMEAAMRSGTRKEIEELYQSAIAYAPRSMNLRKSYMQSLEPRWGGSEEKMIRYAARSRIELGGGPDADRLEAMIPGDRGLRLSEAKEYEPAYAAFSQAIALADRPIYRCSRAFVAYHLHKQAEMLADVRAALVGRPYADYCCDVRASFVAQNDKLPDGFELVDGFLQHDPDHVGLLVQRGWLYKERGDLPNAYKDFAHAAEFGNAWAQTMAGKYLFNGSGGVAVDRDKGLSLLRLAADQGEPNARLSVVQALQATGRNDEAAREQARYAASAAPPAPRSALESLLDLLTPPRAAALLVILIALLLGLRWWRKRR
ncbi:MAG: DUF4034 domain-containing protein [Sterolibacteriaceae bacterium]|uniref:DUF4034 domain-containing protein n=1 Tax=Candidatus Methylophosphatis roskildensis TaxID=2899263 RepID=A0A9D7E4P9_9PROT|nr:DUF4034 domain-containing protein [Candidatus Methylophosphatis roskildensis]MBK7237743.1 DUF4034 domain-containing protein [Sterolibacteriaceae bacterium]